MKASDKARRNRELDRLLARGRLGGPEKDRMFEQVLARLPAEGPAPHWRWQRWAAVAATAAVLLVAGHVALSPQHGPPPRLRSKGQAQPGPLLTASCEGSCRRGKTLMFRVAGDTPPSYLHAYALDPSGKRIWYFPTENGLAPRVNRAITPQVLPKGVRIGPEHRPGSYRLHLLLARRPMTREQVVRTSQMPNQDATIVVRARRRLEVEP